MSMESVKDYLPSISNASNSRRFIKQRNSLCKQNLVRES